MEGERERRIETQKMKRRWENGGDTGEHETRR